MVKQNMIEGRMEMIACVVESLASEHMVFCSRLVTLLQWMQYFLIFFLLQNIRFRLMFFFYKKKVFLLVFQY